MGISHDSVNRFLYREAYSPLDLFEEVRGLLNLKGGTLSVDDTVLDKPYSQYMELVGYFWSDKHHRSVKGINLITLYYTDIYGQHQPINFRVYDKREGKTKNDYFQDMLIEVLAWGDWSLHLSRVIAGIAAWLISCDKESSTGTAVCARE